MCIFCFCKLASVSEQSHREYSETYLEDYLPTLALQQLNWLPITQQLKFREAILMHKFMDKQAPPYLWDKFQKQKYGRTRNSNNLELPLLKFKSGQYRGVKIWNSVNDEVKAKMSLIIFKHNLKKILITVA